MFLSCKLPIYHHCPIPRDLEYHPHHRHHPGDQGSRHYHHRHLGGQLYHHHLHPWSCADPFYHSWNSIKHKEQSTGNIRVPKTPKSSFLKQQLRLTQFFFSLESHFVRHHFKSWKILPSKPFLRHTGHSKGLPPLFLIWNTFLPNKSQRGGFFCSKFWTSPGAELPENEVTPLVAHVAVSPWVSWMWIVCNVFIQMVRNTIPIIIVIYVIRDPITISVWKTGAQKGIPQKRLISAAWKHQNQKWSKEEQFKKKHVSLKTSTQITLEQEWEKQ